MVYNWPQRLWPACCALCGDRTEGPLDLCAGCAEELPWIVQGCSRCALPLPHPGLCGGCQQRPPPFMHAVAPLRYEAPVDHLVTRLKYSGHGAAGNLLGRLLAHAVAEQSASARVDALVPMPLHWRRRWQRGFNQAALIADVVARQLDLPVLGHTLRRRFATPPQQGLTAAQRRRNLRGVFAVSERVDLSGRRLALIDDVVTTGSSAMAASHALLAAGAASVELWCAARTP